MLLKLWRDGVQPGLSIAMIFFYGAFTVINLRLPRRSLQEYPGKKTQKSFATYLMWTFLWGANIILVIRGLVMNPRKLWLPVDNVASIAVAIGLLVVWRFARRNQLTLKDPMVHGGVALVLKSVPQIFQGIGFLVSGGASWRGDTVLIGHATTLVRILQLWRQGREEGLDRHARAFLVSEIGNELSWLLATAAWLWWRFS